MTLGSFIGKFVGGSSSATLQTSAINRHPAEAREVDFGATMLRVGNGLTGGTQNSRSRIGKAQSECRGDNDYLRMDRSCLRGYLGALRRRSARSPVRTVCRAVWTSNRFGRSGRRHVQSATRRRFRHAVELSAHQMHIMRRDQGHWLSANRRRIGDGQNRDLRSPAAVTSKYCASATMPGLTRLPMTSRRSRLIFCGATPAFSAAASTLFRSVTDKPQ